MQTDLGSYKPTSRVKINRWIAKFGKSHGHLTTLYGQPAIAMAVRTPTYPTTDLTHTPTSTPSASNVINAPWEVACKVQWINRTIVWLCS